MKLKTYLSVMAATVALAATSTSATALSLTQGAKPREAPPASYKGDVYVDSRGCAYARANIGKATNWVPRLSPDRKAVICGMNPTFAAGTPRASAPPKPIAPPAPTEVQTAQVSAPASVSTATVTTAAASTVTISGAPAPSNMSAPVRTASVQTQTVAPKATSSWGLFTAGNGAKPSPAPEPTNVSATKRAARQLSVTCPASGGMARVRVGNETVNVNCGSGTVAQQTYSVSHGNGAVTQLVAKPAPAAQMRYAEYRPARASRVIVNGTPPDRRHWTSGHNTLVSGTMGAVRMPYTQHLGEDGFAPEGGNAAAGRFLAPPQGGSYEAYIAAKAAAYAAAGVELGDVGTVGAGNYAKSSQRNYGSGDVRGNPYIPTYGNNPPIIIQNNPYAADYGINGAPLSNPRVIINGGGMAVRGTAVRATAAPAVPNGYRPAWEDGRLNPNRASRTVGGEYQMQTIWSNTVPRRQIYP